ncbi:cytochrome P450, partial [Desarmillaria ectypa]
APFPPGPKGLPFIGNLLDIPSEKEWLTFAKWGEKYGDIVSVSTPGQRLVIINSANMAMDMLDKKGFIYSDRPIVEMGGELVGWKNILGLIPYGARFRTYRRQIHKHFGKQAAMEQFLSIEEQETHRLLKRISAKPEDLQKHIRKMAGAIILRISYGYEIEEDNDPFIALVMEAMNQFSLSTAPGGFLVNLIPILRYLPDWFPGAGFKRTAKEWQSTLMDMVEKPHSYVKQQMAAGKAPFSFASSLLEVGVSEEEECDIKWLAASIHTAGTGTTVPSIYAFFKAMVMFPEVQAKAQVEIDAVVGNDRLPRFDDRERLPYIDALAREVTRWHTVGPTAVPHCASEDDIHSGYFIPRGSFVLGNVWKILHDPAVYDQPFEFSPERFIQTESKKPAFNPSNVAFGFGRRICPGMQELAEASIFISCAMVLAVFDISKYSENGVIFEPDMEQTTGTVSHPSPFKCAIKPRSDKALELINEERDL